MYFVYFFLNKDQFNKPLDFLIIIISLITNNRTNIFENYLNINAKGKR